MVINITIELQKTVDVYANNKHTSYGKNGNHWG